MVIEPDAQRLAVSIAADHYVASSPTIIAAMSIAISLKRIADQLEDNPQRDGLMKTLIKISEGIDL